MQIWSAEIKEIESLYASITGRFSELEKEMVLAQKGLALYPENGRSYWLLGRIAYKKGKYEEALQLLRKAEERLSSFHFELHKDLLLAEQALTNK
jgi:tetratricopeptide (TPR) repeat protein